MTEATATERGARERILAAAVERIASDGIDDMRIARVAMDAGVSTSLVHYHFETREALLGEALEYSYEHAGEVRLADGSEAEADPERRLLEMVDQCLPYPGAPAPGLGAVGGVVAANGALPRDGAHGRTAVRAHA